MLEKIDPLFAARNFAIVKGRRQKKRIFYGQSGSNRFWCFFFILHYDSMCSEMDFAPEKSFSSNYKNSQFLHTAASALSQNGEIAV